MLWSAGEAKGKGHPLRTVLRVSLAVFLLIYLFYGIPKQALFDVFLESLPLWPWWLAALVSIFVSLLVGALRWRALLNSLSLPLSLRQIVRIYFVGQFFNSFLLGTCSGDLARIYYVAKGCPQRRGLAALTVFADRAIGLFIFIIVGAVMIWWFRGMLIIDRQLVLVAHSFIVLFLGGSLLMLLVVAAWPLWWQLAKYFRLTRLPLLETTGDKVDLFWQHYRHRPKVLFVCVVYSFLNLIFLTLACYCFARSLQISLPLADFFLLFPVITVITSIPLTPGGLGVREGLFTHLLAIFGVEAFRSLPLSLLVYMGGVFWSLVGGLFFLRSK